MALAPVLRPDILLLDIDLPGMNGIQLVQELAPRLPMTRIVMLTVSSSERDLIEAVGKGAAGYLTKDLSPEALLRTLRGTSRGEWPCRGASPPAPCATSWKQPNAAGHWRPRRATCCR